MTNEAPSRNHRSRRGQALAETGIIVLLLVVLGAGTVEFGRAFMLVNLITHAARDGARFAAALPDTYRDVGGCYTGAGTTLITNHVEDMIEDVLDASGTFDEVDVAQTLDGAIPTVTVTITGTVEYSMVPGMVGGTFDIDRTITFRDEGRGEGVTC